MESRQLLQWYCKVVDLGSFSAAARALDLMPSSLSRAVQQLETELGTVLMTRSTRRLTLTEAGQVYYRHARSILEALDGARDAVQQLQEVPWGRLRLTAPSQIGPSVLTPLLPMFCARYPRIELEMLYTDRNVDLLEEGYDLALRIQQHRRSTNPRYAAEWLAPYLRHVVASPDYLARHGTPQHPSELVNHTCISRTGSEQQHVWTFTVEGKAEDFLLGRHHATDSGITMMHLAEQGVGIARLGTYLCQELVDKGRLQVILSEYDLPEPWHLVARYPKRPLAAKTRAMIDFLHQQLPLRM